MALTLDLFSLLIIGIIIATLAVFYVKKWLLCYGIIVANFIAFALSLLSPVVIDDLAFRPLYVYPPFDFLIQIYTLFTSMFLHSITDPFHIIFNMLMFLLIAPHFEHHIGAKKFLGIYLLTGVCAALFHAFLAPYLPQSSFGIFDAHVGLIGASGAISGIIGAYAAAYPRDRVFFPVGFFIMRIPVLIAGIFFLTIQTLYIFIGGDASVAYLAHIGGFIVGFFMAVLIIHPQMPQRERVEVSNLGFSTTYEYPTMEAKIRELNMSSLESLAVTPDQKALLNRIKDESMPEVREAWLDHFLERARCPTCHKPLKHDKHRIWCDEQHFQTMF